MGEINDVANVLDVKLICLGVKLILVGYVGYGIYYYVSALLYEPPRALASITPDIA